MPRPRGPAPHYLWVGIALSLLAHAALLGWRAASPAAPRTTPDILDVAIVNAHTEQAPPMARVKAPQSMAGGGLDEHGLATSPLPHTGDSAETAVLQALRQRQAELEQEQLRLLTTLSADSHTATPSPHADEPGAAAATAGQDATEQEAVLRNAQIAALAERIQRYNERPRTQFVGPNAVQAVEAAYIDAWRTRIESTGTRFYPAQSRGALYGSLRLTVSVKSDGSVVGIVIDQPSTEPALNQAARRIVQLAAPFGPFPDELARTTDVLAITRTWNFVNDTLETRQ